MSYSMKDIAERRAVAQSIVEPIITAKRDRTVCSFYERVAPGSDGRIRTVLSSTGTATSRLASSESGVDEASTNLQNQPKKVARMDLLYQVRDILCPAPGMVLAAGDYSGAEALLVAAYSRDWEFVEELLAGVDVHEKHAMIYFNVDDPNDLPPIGRDLAKTIHYLTLYKGTVRTAAQKLNQNADMFGRTFKEKEVGEIRSMFLQLHPLERWWTEVQDELSDNGGWLRNAFGFRRKFYDPDPEYRLKDALSFLPQSTVASLINRSMKAVARHVDRPGEVELIHQNHDELVLQSLPECLDWMIEKVTGIMEQKFSIHGYEMYVPVGWKTGSNWGKGLEKVK